jgi:hypothetical protein
MSVRNITAARNGAVFGILHPNTISFQANNTYVDGVATKGRASVFWYGELMVGSLE